MFSGLRHSKRAISAAFASGLAMGIIGTGIAATSGAVKFPDVPAGSYYDLAVGSLSDRGIIKGNPDGTFNPAGYVTRADVAVMFQRMLVSIGEEEATESSSRSSRRVASSSSEESSSSSSSTSTSSSSVSSTPNGTLRFATPTASIIENASIGGITVAIVRTGGVQGAVGVQISTSDGTAKVTEDYQALSTVLTFAANESSKTIKLPLIDDSAGEGSETVVLTLSEVTGGAVIGTPSQMTITITDNEAPSSTGSSSSSTSAVSGAGKFSFSAVTYGPAENGGTQIITVVRTDGSTGAANVNYATSNGTAVTGTDYGSVSNSLSFASGETSKTFTVSIADNSSIDGNRNFNITLSNPTGGAALGDVPSTSIMIFDDETLTYGTGSLKFTKSAYSVTEASGVALVTVQRIGGAKNKVTVSFATSNGTALASSDYTATSGTMTFEAGETSKLIRIPLLKDTLADADETIYVILSSPTNGATLSEPLNTVVTVQ